MGRLDTEGSLHYHIILFLVFLFIFVTLKNIDFSDFRDSALLTDMQVTFIQILFLTIVFFVVLVSYRGYMIKTPEYATRGLFALLIVFLGLFVILFNLVWDPVVNTRDFEIGGMGTVSMAVSSILIAAGMVVYINIKFAEDRQQKWFIDAVKDTLERIEVRESRSFSSRHASAAATGGRHSSRVKRIKPKAEYSEPAAAPTESTTPVPQTTPAQAAPSAQGQAGTGAYNVSGSPKIIKCPQCTVPLKIPDVPTRPLNIRCPHCGSIGTVYD